MTAVARKEAHPLVLLVPVDWIDTLWDEAAPMLAPAVERSNGRWDMAHLFEALRTGRQNLWAVYTPDRVLKGVMTTEINTYPKCRMVSCQFLGGTDFGDWIDPLLASIEYFAAVAQCDGVECTARHGFWPQFTERGFTRPYTVYEKYLGA